MPAPVEVGDADRRPDEGAHPRRVRVQPEAHAAVDLEPPVESVNDRPGGEAPLLLVTLLGPDRDFTLRARAALVRQVSDAERELPARRPAARPLAPDEERRRAEVDLGLPVLSAYERGDVVVEAARAESLRLARRGQLDEVGEGECRVFIRPLDCHHLEAQPGVAHPGLANARPVGFRLDGLEVEVEEQAAAGGEP